MYEYDEYNPKKKDEYEETEQELTIPQTAWKTNPM